MVNYINQGIDLDCNFLLSNFLVLAAKAMAVLHANAKDNLIYHAACCFGEQRQRNTGPRMPLDRMPFGLIAHNLKFFAPDNVSNLQAPDDCKSSASSPGPIVTVAWVLRGKHSRKRAVGPGRKCRKKCMIQRKSDKIVFY